MRVRSPLIFEMAGKLGNAVAASARGGITYFRALVTPSNPNSFFQNAVRLALAAASAYWRTTLTEDVREQWWDLAEGSQTGQSLFVSVNQPRVYGVNNGLLQNITSGSLPPGEQIYVSTPPDGFATSISDLDLTIDASDNRVNIPAFNEADDWLTGGNVALSEDAPAIIYFYASHEQSASRFSRQHPYRMIAAMAVSDLDELTGIHTIDLEGQGFATVAGRVMYVKYIVQRPDGALSVPVQKRITIVA